MKSYKKALIKTDAKIFNPQKVALTPNASEQAVASILYQEVHPIIYPSGKLTSAVANYWLLRKKP